MNNKRFLVVLARGLEGCGVTRIAIEFSDYVNSLGDGYCAKILANSDKKWGRDNCQQHDASYLKFSTQLDEVKAEIDKYDVVFVMSVPAKNFDDASKDSCVELLKYAHEAGKFVIMSQWDHRIHSISRNMYIDPKYFGMFNYCDLVFNHSYTNDFIVKFIKKNNIALNNLVCRGDGINNLFGINFEALKPMWKTFNEKTSKTVKFIGRTARWKGPWWFRDIHWKYFKDHGYISTMEGIELSIGYLNELYSELKPNRIAREDVVLALSKTDAKAVKDGTYEFKRNSPVYVMPPYNRLEALDRMSRTQFGIELLMMDENLSKDIIENAMMEIVAVGTIPVFRKKWADVFTVDGKPISSYPFEQTGTVLLDETSPEEALALMDKLSEDENAYNAARDAAYSFYKHAFDNSAIYSKMLSIIDEHAGEKNV